MKKLKHGSALEKILEGDRNTAYFHAVANQQRRKKNFILDGPNDPVEYGEDMLNVAANFYKKKLLCCWTIREGSCCGLPGDEPSATGRRWKI
jgi:hypothetical protein